jgi:hypothetical protein
LASRLTDTVPPEMTVEIGDTPINDVRLDVDAGVQIVPPDPSAARR